MEGAANISKGDQPFAEWLNQTYPDPVAQEQFKERHYVTGLELSLDSFREFYEKREEVLKAVLWRMVF